MWWLLLIRHRLPSVHSYQFPHVLLLPFGVVIPFFPWEHSLTTARHSLVNRSYPLLRLAGSSALSDRIPQIHPRGIKSAWWTEHYIIDVPMC